MNQVREGFVRRCTTMLRGSVVLVMAIQTGIAGGQSSAHVTKQPEKGTATANVRVTPANRAGSRSVSLEHLRPLTALQPDVAASPAALPTKAVVPLKSSAGAQMQSVEALLLSSPMSGVAAVVQRDGHSLAGPSFVERFELATGRSLNVASIPDTLRIFDLSPNGRLLATRKMFAGALQSRQIDIWEVDADGTAPQAISFEAVEKTPEADFPKWAHFVGEDNLLILTDHGILSLWSIRSARETWRANFGHGASAETSPSGKYVAVASGHRVVVIEAVPGKALGYIDLGNRPAGLVSFKPDGTSLAIAGPDSLASWDTHTGKLFEELDLPDVDGHAIEWGGDGYVLLDQRRLVSLEKRCVVWTYLIGGTGVFRCTQASGGRLWYPARDEARKNVVASIPLPDDSVRGTVSVVGNPKIALKPGGSVSLQVQGAHASKEITDIVAARLTHSGFTVADHQRLSIVASTEPIGPGQQIMVEVGRKTQYAPMQGLSETISLRSDDGKVLWTRSTTFYPPGRLTLKAGENVDQAVAAATDPSGFFRDVFIPRTFLKKPIGFGASQLKVAAGKAVIVTTNDFE